MPELPDVEMLLECLRERIDGRRLLRVELHSPFILRSVDPPLAEFHGRAVRSLRRLGKRLVFGFEGDLFLVLHLMIAGRLQWKDGAGAPRTGGKIAMASFQFETGTLTMTEAGTRKRSSIHAVRGEADLAEHDPAGLEVSEATDAEFDRTLKKENRTLKRALTNPRAFSGIGNAYSDEILHAARLSPLRLTRSLSEEETSRLRQAAVRVLDEWTRKLKAEFADRFPGPGNVTAFRPDFAAHGKFGQPCPVCGVPIQRIQYAENETNYCPRCQNEDRILADRSLSRLLKADWPRTVEEMEN